MSADIIIQTSEGTLVANGDADPIVTGETHGMDLEVCSQPLEDGRSYADHIVTKPDSLTVVLHVANVSSGMEAPLNMVYSQLRAFCDKRLLATVYTTLEVYENMAIEKVSIPVAAPYKGQADITVEFTRMDLVGDFSRKFRNWYVDSTPVIAAGYANEGKRRTVYSSPAPVSDPVVADEDIPPVVQQEVAWDVPEGEAGQSIMDALKGVLKKTGLAVWSAIKQNPSALVGVASAFTEGQPETLMSCLGFLPEKCRSMMTSAIGAWTAAVFWYDTLSGFWGCHFSDGDGRPIYAGALLPGVNCIKGLNLDFGTEDGSMPVHGIYLLTPGIDSEMDPDAFVKNETTGSAGAFLLVVYSRAVADSYDALLSYGDEVVNYSFADMDYRTA